MDWLPWSMVAINVAAVVAGTAALARWLAARAVNPWWALAYAGCSGIVFAYSRDCTEPLAYALVAAGTVAWLDDRRGIGLVLLALAPLARESTVLFAAGLAAAALAARRWRDVGALAATALPALLWQAYLTATCPRRRSASSASSNSRWPAPSRSPISIPDVSPRCSSSACRRSPCCPARWRGSGASRASPFGWLIALNILLVLIAPNQSWWHVLGLARVAVGAVVALLLAFPVAVARVARRAWRRSRWRRR